jgi:hypothetical protein
MDSRNGPDVEPLSIGMGAATAKTLTDAGLVVLAGACSDRKAAHFVAPALTPTARRKLMARWAGR